MRTHSPRSLTCKPSGCNGLHLVHGDGNRRATQVRLEVGLSMRSNSRERRLLEFKLGGELGERDEEFTDTTGREGGEGKGREG
ncbi:hypothetical protein KC19_2G155500 [Ceratodon purpureus]|uniref:Uncharacterized protein n=1 Tax=Ceratodon purpureus TaxID=3225 RepID=A0A8T0IVU3_CERPU|nr:hypothetical protein KC19_2G155500 [Ceratodon purpureus]